MRNERLVAVKLSVPIEMTDAKVQEMLEIVINEGLREVAEYAERYGHSHYTGQIRLMQAVKPTYCRVIDRSEHSFNRTRPVNVDYWHYVGNEADGMYFEAWEEVSGQWYLYGILDSDSCSFCDTFWDEEGPFDNYDRAIAFGRDGAEEWCANNNVVDEHGCLVTASSMDSTDGDDS